ncbi:N-acetyl-alpha-D-glucosaminyl L-malate synthase BshA [Bacillus alkalicellulosilyticus]|uniref:N-acetyl-alpha-D-glucosaminyl L-malate synthase BshA n=1 Tax=Alkalihalobacterium alkalicellulosilyticum TaxID=1912214 RepID=UPI000996D357|nr:N-acetyl-alpha-D-glucosaminyl L-malate synthase BshA [Bacillus alkalicellulosilyticus]
MTLKIGISCYPSVGGSGVIATELGKFLAEKGHEVHFITSSMPFRLDRAYPNLYYHEVEVNQYSVFKYPPYDLSLASKMAEIILREGLDILHVHYAVPHAICAYLAKQMVGGNINIVTTLHGTDISVLGYDPSLSEIIRFGIEQSDVVTAVSNDLVKETKELLQISKPIDTVYNFIDERIYYKRPENGLRKHYYIEEDEKVIVHISNFRAVKRVTDIVRSFAKVNETVKSKLILIGDGPETTVACRLAKELGIKDRVLFLGNQKHVAEILSMSDLMFLLSEKESFGLSALEALACGVPVIGTRVGGIPEVIEDGKSGFICELGNIDEIAEKAITILTNDKLHQEMSDYAQLRVRDFFSSTQIVEQYEGIYKNTLAK